MRGLPPLSGNAPSVLLSGYIGLAVVDDIAAVYVRDGSLSIRGSFVLLSIRIASICVVFGVYLGNFSLRVLSINDCGAVAGYMPL